MASLRNRTASFSHIPSILLVDGTVSYGHAHDVHTAKIRQMKMEMTGLRVKLALRERDLRQSRGGNSLAEQTFKALQQEQARQGLVQQEQSKALKRVLELLEAQAKGTGVIAPPVTSEINNSTPLSLTAAKVEDVITPKKEQNVSILSPKHSVGSMATEPSTDGTPLTGAIRTEAKVVPISIEPAVKGSMEAVSRPGETAPGKNSNIVKSEFQAEQPSKKGSLSASIWESVPSASQKGSQTEEDHAKVTSPALDRAKLPSDVINEQNISPSASSNGPTKKLDLAEEYLRQQRRDIEQEKLSAAVSQGLTEFIESKPVKVSLGSSMWAHDSGAPAKKPAPTKAGLVPAPTTNSPQKSEGYGSGHDNHSRDKQPDASSSEVKGKQPSGESSLSASKWASSPPTPRPFPAQQHHGRGYSSSSRGSYSPSYRGDKPYRGQGRGRGKIPYELPAHVKAFEEERSKDKQNPPSQ